MNKLYALLPLLAALFVPGTLSAQMMPDSTVQVVAYWEVGDQMEYIYTEHKYEIDADGRREAAGYRCDRANYRQGAPERKHDIFLSGIYR